MKLLKNCLLALMIVCMAAASSALAETTADVTLADWEGTWNNYTAYFDKAEFVDAANEHLKGSDEKLEDILTPFREMMKADFATVKIAGNTMIMLDGFVQDNGAVISESEYTFVQTHKTMFGEHEVTWYEFKATGDSKYPIMLITESHAHHDDSMKHFHFRYGDDVQKLLSDENANWFPTVVDSGSTMEQLTEELVHHHD